MSETQEFIGKFHTQELPRDAIHIAVCPVGAGCTLCPGQAICFKEGSKSIVMDAGGDYIGIVDPYLKVDKVSKGMMFYMFLNPNSVTSLSHSWTHPAFADANDKAKAEKWLKDITEHGYSYEDDSSITSFDYAVSSFKSGDIPYFSDTFTDKLNVSPEMRKKYWDMLEVYTGKMATEEQRNLEYFSCSC